MKVSKFIFYLFLILHLSGINAQNSLNEGLYFSSHEVIQDKRTSLLLTSASSIDLPEKFSLTFEAKFRKGDGYYGDIFRIIADQTFNIDLVSNLSSQKANFWLIAKDTMLFSYKWSDIPEGKLNKWLRISLDIDKTRQEISLSINGKRYRKPFRKIKDLKTLDIVFGASKIKHFLSTDVCPMTLKNIRIYKDNRLFRYWRLGKHGVNQVYDELKSIPAKVHNPKWIIDQHLHWKKISEIQFNAPLVGITMDSKHNNIYFVDEQSVYAYYTSNNTLDTLKYSGSPFPCTDNNLVYNPAMNELWSYSSADNEISRFNFQTKAWSVTKDTCVEADYWQHNKLILSSKNNLITFGGYGHYLYKNDFKEYNLKNKQWTIRHSSSIAPRYLSGVGLQDDHHLLIFGGYGSKTGRQEINSQNYYDLYRVNLGSLKTTKLWQFDKIPEQPFVPLNNIIVNPTSENFYTLIYNNTTYNTYLKLARFDFEKPNMIVYHDSIPYQFLDVKSWGSVFLNSEKNTIYTITNSHNSAAIYSMAYPPLFSKDVIQPPRQSNRITILWIGFASILLMSITLFLYRRYKQHRQSFRIPDNPLEEENNLHQIKIDKIKKHSHSSISLLGGFQVFDSRGRDITAQFTPTLKQLFLLIFLYSSENKKGISSVKLTEILWYDKIESSARNNRNVNMSKLRLLLDKIDGIQIYNQNTYWQMHVNKSIYCDYTRALELTKLLNHNIEDENLYEFLSIIASGELCPNIQIEWMDDFKVHFANQIINTLTHIIQPIEDDLNLKIIIANGILKFDPLHEEALIIKCSAMYHIGKRGLAKQTYDNFCKEYKLLLGSPYHESFKKIIS